MSSMAGHIRRGGGVECSHGCRVRRCSQSVQKFRTNCPESLDVTCVQIYCTEVPTKAPTAPQIHPAHAANMAAKADRFARFLHTHITANPAIVAQLDDSDWDRITDLMGETRTPSPATRAMTVVLLRALRAAETIAERSADTTDPFAGLA